jgi:D-glycero-beta-D-manno-heptose-7-phosphate kinase
MEGKPTYKLLFEDFTSKNVLIIGDVMIDSYLWGKVERISPEAPVPVVALSKRENRLGGAANVALNVRSMGASPILCSVVGNDRQGELFVELMKSGGLTHEALIRSNTRITTTKFRIIGNNAQLLRVDEEIDEDLGFADENLLFEKARDILSKYAIDVIILQDYNKGVLTRELIRKVIDLACEKGIPVTVDPKKKNFDAYKGVSLFKPNLKELREGLKADMNTGDQQQIEMAVNQLREKFQIDIVLTTLSEQGVIISGNSGDQGNQTIFIPAHRRSIADVSGAGDTVIAVASLCLASHTPLYDIAAISNLAGGLVCEDVGVSPVDREKLLEEINACLPHGSDS